MFITRKNYLAAAIGVMLATPVIADDAETDRLRSEIDVLQKQYDDQSIRLMRLEARVQRLSFYNQSYTSPNGFVKTADYRSGNIQVAQGTASGQQAAPVKTAATTSADEEVVKEAPASRSTQAVYQEQHALFDRKFTFEPGFTYTSFDRNQLLLNGFLALDSIFLGTISVDEVEAQILTLNLDGRYGLTDRAQMDFSIPFLYRNTNYQSAGAGGASTSLIEDDVTRNPELGDVSVGFYYQLVKEQANWPDVVWNVRVKAPTGTDPYGISIVDVDGTGNLMIPEELPTGNGLWALSTGLSFVRTIDPAILFASVNYTHNFEDSFNDISSADGNQPGKIDLGSTFSYGLGIAFALNERSSMSFGYSQSISEKSRQRLDSTGNWQSIIGSDANSAQLNIGATYALSDRSSWITNIGVGLNTDAPDVTFSMKFPYTF